TLITLVAGPMNGMLMLNMDGTFTYTPDMDFNGMDTFQYSYCDDGVPNLCDTATANINLAPVNDPPRITQNGNDVDTIFVTVPEDMIDTTCVTVIDVDGDMVACSLISLPMNGTAALLNDTCIVYQPDMNYFGPDQTIKIADDGNGGTDTVVVIYDVTPVNDPPVAMDDTYNVVQGNTLMATVIANDVDVDGPDTLVTLVAGPFNGMLMLNLDGSFSYTPNGGFTGTDTFQYAYCDGGTPELCDTAMVAINVADNVLNIRPVVLLQGALLGNGGGLLMRDDLRSGGYIPTVEPYSGLASFEHRNGGGGETITMPATVLADSGANSIVDWVFVELRSAADSAQVVATRSALVQRDGDVVDVDGTSAVMFPGVIDGDYFVSIRHRNHLGAMTAGAVSLSSVAMVIDFTDINTDFYNRIAQFDGFEQATVEGAYALYLGNTNFNDRVNYAGQANDTDAIFQAIVNDAGNPGMLQSFVIDRYISTDVNLDGLTKYTGLANDVDPVFNVAVTSALNGSGIVTFNLVEQLPDSGGL
ncbi:Ig-like domain-containing protein, partial [Phaeodactylibacter luteus]